VRQSGESFGLSLLFACGEKMPNFFLRPDKPKIVWALSSCLERFLLDVPSPMVRLITFANRLVGVGIPCVAASLAMPTETFFLPATGLPGIRRRKSSAEISSVHDVSGAELNRREK
jgi:hypothetical protein